MRNPKKSRIPFRQMTSTFFRALLGARLPAATTLVLIPIFTALPVAAYNKGDIDKMTSYAVILGRAIGCGIDTDEAAKYVGRWFDSRWPRRSPDQGTYLMILADGIKMHADEQRSGRAPDSCSEVRRQFNLMKWR